MMKRPSDEQLIAFLDGEVGEADFAEIEAWLDRDPGVRERLKVLSETTALVREAFDEVLQESVPERLVEAARAKRSATILTFRPNLSALGGGKHLASPRWWVGAAAAASVACMVFGASIGYIAAGGETSFSNAQPQQQQTASWLDNIAGYHNLFIASANGAENTVFDVPAGAEKRLPVDIRIPDLKAWGLAFQGARKLVVEGKPAYQFYYTTDNKQLGPITLTVTTSTRPDMAPTFDRRDNVNLLYWRHAGHGYAIVGQADKGYMWGLANDIAWQLKAI